jgi:hypothetical protein
MGGEHTHVYVSTKSNSSMLETMVFKCGSNGIVTSWHELDCATYSNKPDAAIGHKIMLAKWGKLASFA